MISGRECNKVNQATETCTTRENERTFADCHDDQSLEGMRFLIPGRHPFSTHFAECIGGRLEDRECPPSAVFYLALQCCVPVGAFPCLPNCVA